MCVFPIDCMLLLPIRITTNYGNPYPNQRVIYSGYFKQALNVARELKKLERVYHNILPNLQSLGNFPSDLSTIENRIRFIDALAKTKKPISGQLVNIKKYLTKGYPNFMSISFHPGVDINYGSTPTADVGLPVYSVASGRVIASNKCFCKNCDCSGFVAIEHRYKGKVFYSLYGHIDPAVSVGSEVKAAQRIGVIGRTSAFAPHLHFEITTKNIYSNFPYRYPSYTNFSGKTTLQLNMAYVAAIAYDDLNGPSVPTQLCLPFKYYVNAFDNPRNPSWDYFSDKGTSQFQSFSDNVFYGGEYSKKYGYVDPINFLREVCGKLCSPANNNPPCPNIEKLNQQPDRICFSIRP